MAEYIVTRKADGAEVLRYSAAQAQEVNGFDLVDYQHTVLADYLQLMELAQEINLDDPDTVAAVQMLEQSGLIAAGRAVEVLA